MAKIKIAELEIDDKALIASTAKVKKEIDQLKEAQKELKKEGQSASKEFVKNASDLKVLSKEYNSNIKVLGQRTQAIADAANRQDLLTIALNSEVSSIAEAREQNKLLNKLRNESNALTAEGQKEIEALNNALDANNDFIKENADGYLKQKINIGNYTDSINDAFGGLGNFLAKSKEAGGVLPLVGTTIKSVSSSLLGLTKSALTFLATPIGALLGLIVAGFLLVKNAMNRSEEATNKITKVFSVFGGIANKVLSALEPLGEFLIDVIVDSFELVGEAAKNALNIVNGALSFFGFDGAAEAVDNFGKSMKEGIKNAQELADAEASLEKAQRKSASLQLEYQKNAEKLRQIRDDETLTIAERNKANEALGVLLKEQLGEELKLAEQARLVANLRIRAEGETKELLEQQEASREKILEIQERITGQESEQLTNRVALQKEAADKAKEFADKAIAQQEAELELFIQSQGVRAMTLSESLEIAKQVYSKEVDILKANLKNRNLTKTQFDAQFLALQNELLLKQADLASDNAQRELDLFISNNQSKIDSEKFFSDESLRIEQERLNSIAEKQKEFQASQLENGIINKQEYNDAINAIDEENRLKNIEAQKLRDEAQKEQDVLNAENQRLLDEEKFQSDLELQLFRLEQRRLQEVANAEKIGADTTLINERYAEQKREIEENVQESKIAAAGASLDVIIGLINKESALGKAAALSQALINTYQGISAGVKLGFPAAIPAIASATAVGFKAVSNISGTNNKFEQGGIQEIGGKRHSQGGTKFYGEDGTTFEAERGEGIGVLSRSAFSGFMDFNNSFKGGTSGNGKFAGGGVITQAVRPQNNSVDFRELNNAISNMRIQVAVEDINTGQGNYADVVNTANV